MKVQLHEIRAYKDLDNKTAGQHQLAFNDLFVAPVITVMQLKRIAL